MSSLRIFILTCLMLLGGLFAVRPAHAGQPNFSMSVQSVNHATTYLGDTLVYTIKLDNTLGTADATDVWLSNQNTPGLQYMLGTLDGISLSLSLLSDDIYVGTIPAGTSRTAVFSTLVAAIPRAPRPAQYDSFAAWRYRYQETPGGPSINATYSANTVTSRMVRLEPYMTVSARSVGILGTEYTYRIHLPNTGTLNSSSSTLTTVIPVGGVYVAGSTKLNGVTVPDITLLSAYTLDGLVNSPGEPAGQINIGEEAVVEYKVTAVLGINVNVAVIDADGVLNPIPPINIPGAATFPEANLGVTITDNQTSIAPGSSTSYTIRVSNAGPTTVTGVGLDITPPAALKNVTYSASAGTFDAAAGNWTGISLASGQNVTLTMSGKISALALGSLSTSATVFAPSGVADSTTGNNTASDTTSLVAFADLGVTLSDGVTMVARGDQLNYLVTVTNNGPSSVTSMTLGAVLSLGLTGTTATPNQGSYNAATGAWTGLNVQPGESVTLRISGAVPTLAVGTVVNTVTVTAPAGVTDLVATNNVAADTNAVLLGATLSGAVYLDANHNGQQDGAENGLGLAGFFVKLVPGAGGTAVKVAAVSNGVYSLTSVGLGTYTLVLDDNNALSDTTPALPAGYLATGPTNLKLENVVVTAVDQQNLDFGVWHGTVVSGTVWNDNGAGGGTANDVTRNGSEAGISGVSVRVLSASTLVDSATTGGGGAYTLWIPASAVGSIQIVESQTSGWVSVGARVGSGSYNRGTDTVTLSVASGTAVSGIDFADVPVNTFSANAGQSVAAGTSVFLPHVFTAGTAGTVTFSTTGSAANWTQVLYRDSNGNGVVDSGEPVLTGGIALQSGEKAAIVVKVFVPPHVAGGAQNRVDVTGDFVYSGVTPALSSSLKVTDALVIGSQSALKLVQSVDKVAARTGDLLTYTITYSNGGVEPLSNFSIRAQTPAYTKFAGASYGTLPGGLSGCTVNGPAAGGTGSVVWQFTGILSAGMSGIVQYQVHVE